MTSTRTPWLALGCYEKHRAYNYVDMGRIDFAKVGERLSVGDRVELLPALGFQTIIHHRAYHCVSGDELVDIWPIDALPNW